ncbi:protein FAM222A-like [Aplochiton taeniatus]
MLACIQRRQQTLSSQRLVCTPKMLDVPALPIARPLPPQQPATRKGEPVACMTSSTSSFTSSPTSSRYPTAADLDAFAQKTAGSPLSIKIFPSNIRVPQHKQLSRTINGLDTTGQRYGPYSQPYSAYYGGLLAVVKATAVGVKGVLKNSEGKRKHSPAQTAVAPYNVPFSNGSAASRHLAGSCKPPEGSSRTISSRLATSGVQGLARSSEPVEVHHLLRQMSRPAPSQALQQQGAEGNASPSHWAVAAVACSESGFALRGPAQSSLAHSGAVLPTQSADMAKAGYLEGRDYTMWQHKQQLHHPHHHHQQQQQTPQQHYRQGTLRMYNNNVNNNAQGCSGGGAVVSRSPETCLPLACSSQLSYRHHALSAGTNGVGTGAGQDQVSSSPLNCGPMHGEFSVGPYFAPLWNSVLATPNSDCYTSQEMAPGSTLGRPRDLGLSHPNHHHHQPPPHPSHHLYPQSYLPHLQLQPAPHHPQACNTDQSLGLCCGLPSTSLCHASVLSSSLQSLECLISEIHPPCIKEHMLGRGYDGAMGMPQLLEPHQHTHIQLPVYR